MSEQLVAMETKFLSSEIDPTFLFRDFYFWDTFLISAESDKRTICFVTEELNSERSALT